MPLHALDDDALARVVALLPQSDDWVFVALASRAFARAARRAFAEVQRAALEREGLPGADGVLGTPKKRMATTFAGIMASPHRFAYAKRSLAHHGSLAGFFAPPPVRAVLGRGVHASRGVVCYDPRAVVETEFVAAYNLSLRAVFEMLRCSPVSMVRGSFFEVLGGGSTARLSLTLPHHRALVMYAAFFGRIDVLEWLVHRNPNRARAYDFQEGLMQLFSANVLRWYSGDDKGARLPSQGPQGMHSSWRQIHPVALLSFNEVQSLLARPAAVGNCPAVLEWLDHTLRVLCEREGMSMTRFTVQNIETTRGASFLGQALRQPHVVWPDAHLTINPSAWKAFHNVILEAAAAGAVAVLDAYAAAILAQDHCGASQHQLRGFANLAIFTLLVVVLKADRVGASHRWLVGFCVHHSDQLQSLATLGFEPLAVIDHTFGGTVDTAPFHCFDLEDLIWATTHPLAFFAVNNADALAALNIDVEGTRDRLVEVGDASYTRWLLAEFHDGADSYTRCLLAEFRDGAGPRVASEDDVPRGWFRRSRKQLSTHRIALGDVLERRHAPDRPSWPEVVCEHLLNGSRVSRIHWGVGTNAKGLGPFADDPIRDPDHFVGRQFSMARLRPWLTCHGETAGPPRLAGRACVLGRWMVCTLNRDARVEWPYDAWMDAIIAAPAACCGALDAACGALAKRGLLTDAGADAERTRACSRMRAVLADSAGHLLTEGAKGSNGRRTCALELIHLLVKYDLMNTMTRTELLDKTKVAPFHCREAVRAALGAGATRP